MAPLVLVRAHEMMPVAAVPSPELRSMPLDHLALSGRACFFLFVRGNGVFATAAPP